jgi:hypothetical protein
VVNYRSLQCYGLNNDKGLRHGQESGTQWDDTGFSMITDCIRMHGDGYRKQKQDEWPASFLQRKTLPNFSACGIHTYIPYLFPIPRCSSRYLCMTVVARCCSVHVNSRTPVPMFSSTLSPFLSLGAGSAGYKIAGCCLRLTKEQNPARNLADSRWSIITTKKIHYRSSRRRLCQHLSSSG